MKPPITGESGFSKVLLTLVFVLIVSGALYVGYRQSPSFQEAFHSVKESTQDAGTTSRVHTALLLSKRVSPFNIKVETIGGEVSLAGQVPSEEVKAMGRGYSPRYIRCEASSQQT